MYLAKHQKVSDNKGKVVLMKGGLLGAALISTAIAGTAMSVTASANTVTANQTASAVKAPAKTAAQVKEEALLVIHGDLGNGSERIENLKKAGFNPDEVQDKVNEILDQVGYDDAYQEAEKVSEEKVATSSAATSAASAAPVAESQAVAPSATSQTESSAAPVSESSQSEAASSASQTQETTKQATTETATNASDVASYAAEKMAANTGVSADQWAAIIARESGGNPNAQNSSSGAYGLFQLLGHGEYQGMSVDDQIKMATQVYQSQGAGAWSETW